MAMEGSLKLNITMPSYNKVRPDDRWSSNEGASAKPEHKLFPIIVVYTVTMLFIFNGAW